MAQPKTTETETKSKIPNDEKKGDNNSHKKTTQKLTRKKKEGNVKPENQSVQRGRIEERNDQKWKQGGLEKGMAKNWLEGPKQKPRKERGNKEKTRETKRE